jgi:hypothetical protein
MFLRRLLSHFHKRSGHMASHSTCTVQPQTSGTNNYGFWNVICSSVHRQIPTIQKNPFSLLPPSTTRVKGTRPHGATPQKTSRYINCNENHKSCTPMQHTSSKGEGNTFTSNTINILRSKTKQQIKKNIYNVHCIQEIQDVPN